MESSPLYSPDLAPVPQHKRTWNKWNLAALWVGMAVCIPTYILASYMIRSGLSWRASLAIIGLANLVITIPMVLNGHAGVKYGIPFPVFGRSSFGTKGIHLVSIVRAVVACGWFGVQTWVGGLAFYSIWNAVTGNFDEPGLNFGEFVAFGFFWIVNMYFIWKGTESIKWLEDWSAPILILIGLLLIYWGYQKVGSFSQVLLQGEQLQKKTAIAIFEPSKNRLAIDFHPIIGLNGLAKADSVQVSYPHEGKWLQTRREKLETKHTMGFWPASEMIDDDVLDGKIPVRVSFLKGKQKPSEVEVFVGRGKSTSSQLWEYLLWFTAMVGFWATMSISISDVTRYAKSQKDQI